MGNREVSIELLNALKGKRIIAHNAYFDLETTKNYFGVDLWSDLYVDTILLKHTVDEVPPFGLKDLSAKLFGVEAKAEQEELQASIKENGGGGKKELYKAKMEVIAKYCLKDTELTMKLYEHYIPILKKEGLEKFFFEDEVMPLYKKVTRVMQSRGIPLDISLLKKVQKEIGEEMGKIEQFIQAAISDYTNGEFKEYYINKNYPPSSSGDFAQACLSLSGLPIPKLKSGKFKVSKKELERHSSNKYISFILDKSNLNEEEIREVQEAMYASREEDIPYIFNIQSKHHLKKLFFSYYKEEPISKTDKGNPQVDEDTLEHLSNKYQWIKELIVYNKLSKIRGTYIERFLEEQEDGTFYPDFFQAGTVSGRYGSDMQQLNRPFEEEQLKKGLVDKRVFYFNNEIRKFFIAGSGYKFVDIDYQSLEPHVFAHVSGDKDLQDIFNKGFDFYSTIAIRTEGIKGVSSNPKDENYLGKVNKGARQKAKAYCLGIPYGMSSYALGLSLGIEQEEAERLRSDYLNGFINLNKWYEDSEAFVKKHGYIKSEAGRVRHLKLAKELYSKYGDSILDSLELWKRYHGTDAYEHMKALRGKYKQEINNAKNFQIQSLSASIVNRAAIAIQVELDRLGIVGYLCAQVHDELIVRVREEDAEKFAPIMQNLMENTYKLSIALKAPITICNNLYEGKL